jgi:hypothetical protein
MTPGSLLDALAARGVVVSHRGGQLVVKPRSALTAPERAFLRDNAARVVRTLRARAAVAEATARAEREADDAVRRQRAEMRERARQRRVASIVALDRRELLDLVESGALTADDVRLWTEAREHEVRRIELMDQAVYLAQRLGRRVTLL